MKRIGILTIFLISILSMSVSAVLLSDQGTDVTVKSSGQLLSSGDLTVLIYTTATGGSPIYNQTFTNAIDDGSWNVMLGETSSLDLEYGTIYYKDYLIEGEDADFIDGTGSTVERQIMQSPLGDIDGSVYVTNITNGTGTTNRIPKWIDSTTLGDSTFVELSDGRFGNYATPPGLFFLYKTGLVPLIPGGFDVEFWIMDGQGGNNATMKLESGPTGQAQIIMNGSSIVHDRATETMRFTVDSNEVMRLDNSQRVGIGTTDPTEMLTIDGNTSTLKLGAATGTSTQKGSHRTFFTGGAWHKTSGAYDYPFSMGAEYGGGGNGDIIFSIRDEARGYNIFNLSYGELELTGGIDSGGTIQADIVRAHNQLYVGDDPGPATVYSVVGGNYNEYYGNAIFNQVWVGDSGSPYAYREYNVLGSTSADSAHAVYTFSGSNNHDFALLKSGRLAIPTTGEILWSQNANAYNLTYDTGISRDLAGVVKINNGTDGYGDLIANNIESYNGSIITNILQLNKVSTPPATCNSTNEGAIYSDDDLNLPCYCNSTAWVQMNDFSTVCS